jgi:hypothetical protein
MPRVAHPNIGRAHPYTPKVISTAPEGGEIAKHRKIFQLSTDA